MVTLKRCGSHRARAAYHFLTFEGPDLECCGREDEGREAYAYGSEA
jgi:hypothetical protein